MEVVGGGVSKRGAAREGGDGCWMVLLALQWLLYASSNAASTASSAASRAAAAFSSRMRSAMMSRCLIRG